MGKIQDNGRRMIWPILTKLNGKYHKTAESKLAIDRKMKNGE